MAGLDEKDGNEKHGEENGTENNACEQDSRHKGQLNEAGRRKNGSESEDVDEKDERSAEKNGWDT